MRERYLAAVRSRQPEDNAGNKLFSGLLRPTLREGLPKRLVIIPDSRLHLLPFDALKDEAGKYILESSVVTYAPSATVLHLLRQSRPVKPASLTFLGVGGVIHPQSATVVSAATGSTKPMKDSTFDFFDVQGIQFPDLPGSRQEVMSVAGIVSGVDRVLLGADATETNFKGLPLADFGVIHLAVHGVANSQFPDRAALVLSNSPESHEDGLLQVREIRDLAFNAELVTLSACDSGSGRLLGEEGIANLERAFLLAGAKSVVASLWTADDTFTIALMKRMYQHLADGDDKGAALRQSKLDLLKEFGNQALPMRRYFYGFKTAFPMMTRAPSNLRRL